MSLTLTALGQFSIPVDRESNAALLTDISVFNALSQRERNAIRVYCLAKELANKSATPVTRYDPATAAGIGALAQDTETTFGPIAKDNLQSAQSAIDWANAKVVFSTLSTDLETLRGQVQTLVNFTDDELERMLLFLRLEIRA